jgi:hypothetical protein
VWCDAECLFHGPSGVDDPDEGGKHEVYGYFHVTDGDDEVEFWTDGHVNVYCVPPAHGSCDEKSSYYADADADGYGDADTTITACEAPAGYVANASDCDDDDASVHPGATDVCDLVDNDCDGDIDEGLVCDEPCTLPDASALPAGFDAQAIAPGGFLNEDLALTALDQAVHEVTLATTTADRDAWLAATLVLVATIADRTQSVDAFEVFVARWLLGYWLTAHVGVHPFGDRAAALTLASSSTLMTKGETQAQLQQAKSSLTAATAPYASWACQADDELALTLATFDQSLATL